MECPHEVAVLKPWGCENSRESGPNSMENPLQPDSSARENRTRELPEGPWEAKASRYDSHELKVSWEGARHTLSLHFRAPAGSGRV